jgi:hypothetical protein
MPAPTSCSPCCDTTNTVNTPGSAGQDAFTTTGVAINIPAPNASIGSTLVGSTSWMAVGGVYFISDDITWGHFQCTAITDSTHATFTFLNYTDDSPFHSIIGSGAALVASGTQQDLTLPLPIASGGTGQITAPLGFAALYAGSQLPIANGGTAGTSKATAIAALGVGQVATVSTLSGLTYDVTNAAAQITGSTLSVPSTGSYLVLATVTVLFTGTTFVANRTLTFSIRNTTDAANVLTITRDTGIQTTATQPSVDYVFPFTVQSLTAAKTLQLYASMDVVESAGSTVVTAASLCILPIAI